MIWTAVILLLVAGLFGMPLFAVILGATLLGFTASEIDLSVVAIEIFRLADMPLLVALPLFTFAGYCLSESQASMRFLRLVQAVTGKMKSGLAIIALILCAIFTAFTGASGVTIVALGAVLFPALIKAGYRPNFSLGLVTTSGSLGLLLPPSVPLILYAVVAGQMELPQTFTIQELFRAGLLPSLLMLLALSTYCVWANRGVKIARHDFSWRELKAAILGAGWELPCPIFVVAGIYGGYFTVSEVAAVTVAYVLLVEVGVYREISFSKLLAVTRQSMVATGAILLILAASLGFSNFLIDAEVPLHLFAWMQQHISSQWAFLAFLNLVLLLLGAVLDIFAALFIMVPLILPLAIGYGVDPVHLGIIFLANMQIGYLTPPIGMNLFIASFRFKQPILTICKAVVPYVLVLLATLGVITYWPALSLGLS